MLPAPKRALPGHAESYNPPAEYLLDNKEVGLAAPTHTARDTHTHTYTQICSFTDEGVGLAGGDPLETKVHLPTAETQLLERGGGVPAVHSGEIPALLRPVSGTQSDPYEGKGLGESNDGNLNVFDTTESLIPILDPFPADH